MVKAERCASKGDLVIAITSEDDEGSCKCTAWMADYDAYVGGHTAIYKHNLNPIFVSYYFKASRFQKAKLEYTHGFKVVEINPKDIAKISICYPSLSEQQQIVAHLDALSAKVKELEKINEQTQKECDALKQAMLREIFE
jgi:type I restriction enzyme S subunit